MKQHAEKCWSKETVRAAYELGDVEKARAELQKHGKMGQSKITLGLKKIMTWAESFSTRPPSKEEIRCVIECSCEQLIVTCGQTAL